MFNASLPKIEKTRLDLPHFPTLQQAIIWRNWELVPVERIAEVLSSTEENIIEFAHDMGLRVPPIVNDDWLHRGYITIIRNNWHILSYEQLLTLLGWSAGKLIYILKEDDFLSHKLGNFKPDVEEVIYTPLTNEQKLLTKEIRFTIEKHFSNARERQASSAFSFLKDFAVKVPETRKIGIAKNDEVILDNGWNVVFDHCNRNTEAFVKRFITNHESKWGIRLNSSEGVSSKNIKLQVKDDTDKLAESHNIEITEDTISITSVDEVGLLRGLQWIEKAMNMREGPFLDKGLVSRDTHIDTRIIYSYSAVYGDSLLEPELDPYPEGLLAKLSELGVNGIWLQGILYSLVPWDEAPELSVHWEKRLEGLRNLTDRASKYGIGVYLYLNEPRAMPHAFFDKYPEWKGDAEGDYSALCTSVQPVKDYLKNGVGKIFEEVPELAGIITITMSENLTNCYSRVFDNSTNCSRCTQRRPQEVISEVNRLIAEGAHNAKPDARIICWTWGWQNTCGREGLWIKEAVNMLPGNVSIMCTSEEGIETSIAGISAKVLDYSMSIAGPGERALRNWRAALNKGLKTVAKVQFNNTWECSAVPYIPVPGLVDCHMSNLTDAGVSGVMLGWTLGGYPSLNLEIASQYYWKQDNVNTANLYKIVSRKFGEKAGKIINEALALFGDAFKEFPFYLDVLYTAPQNFGPGNLLYLKPTGFGATMLGFPYDDLTTWRGIYPEDIFEEQFNKLSKKWKKGLDKLVEAMEEIDTERLEALTELKDVSEAVYCHFRSTYLQIAFIRQRNLSVKGVRLKIDAGIKVKLIKIIDEEIDIAKRLYDIARRDSRIGYEASNHYYYTQQDLMEKVVSCEYLRRELINI